MDSICRLSSEMLLARINRELEKISEVQYQMARRKSVLREQATRLRLGATPGEVRVALRVGAAAQNERRQWSTAPSRQRRAVAGMERFERRSLQG